MKKITIFALTIMMTGLLAGSAVAVPRLQTYIVDSEFYSNYQNIEEDVWVTTSRNFDLKVVGYWAPADLDDSKLTNTFDVLRAPMAYDQLDTYLVISVPTGQSGTVWINGVEINSFYNYGDAGLDASAPSWYTKTLLPSLKNYNFYHAGSLDNDEVGAWHYDHGMIHEPGWGDEMLFDVVVHGFEWTHMDAVGRDSFGKLYKAPHSHDSSYFATPEPGTLSLLGLGLLGIAPLLRKKKNS